MVGPREEGDRARLLGVLPDRSSDLAGPGTLENLIDAGYTIDPSHVYLKDATAQTEPWLSSCVMPAPTPTDPNATKFICTTIQYKSMTRQHIESLGYNIVANFGDQFSDLKGGFADTTYKIPNPMYFLP